MPVAKGSVKGCFAVPGGESHRRADMVAGADQARHHVRADQCPAEMLMITWVNLLVLSPNAVTGLLSQMPKKLLNMWLCATVTATGVPPENTSTPVVLVTGPGGPSSGSPRRLFLPMELRTITLPFRSSGDAGPWACIVTPASPLPAM